MAALARAGVFLVAVSVAAAPRAADSPVELMQTGTFHGGEVVARSGELWVGLAPTRTASKRAPGNLVGRVAAFRTVGC